MALIHDIFTLSALTLSGEPTSAGAFKGLLPGPDSEDGGRYVVAGTTVDVGSPDAPAYRKVRLHDLPSGRLVREAWTDATTGAFSFPHMRIGPWYVTAHDHTGDYNAIIADRVYGVVE